MKFLQTGDIHLGKSFFEQPLLDDQEHMLGQLADELERAMQAGDPYDALIIAGDVYDRAVPPPEAVTLFDSFLTRLHGECPDLHVFIISGNHDSPRRLSFASRLLESQRIHIATGMERLTQPVVLERSAGKGASHGTGRGKTEKVAVYSLPFLTQLCLGDGLCRQQDMAEEAVRRILERHAKDFPGARAVLCAHLFTTGGKASDSERVFVGAAEQVDAAVFEPFAYTALGHLHRCQNPARNVWYAGSPLAYSFGEADKTGAKKYFLRVTLGPDTGGEARVEKIPVVPLRPVAALEGRFEDFYRDTDGRFSEFRDALIEISCTDEALVENPMAKLKPIYPNLLSFRQDKAVVARGPRSIAHRREALDERGKDGGTDERIFTAFMRETHGTLPDSFQQELELFLRIARGKEAER